MINVAISIAVMVAVTLALGFGLGGGTFNPYYGALPGIIGLVATYLLLVRRTLRIIEGIMGRAQVELVKLQEATMKAGGRRPSKAQTTVVIDRAAEIIKEGFAQGRWQFLVDAQIHAQLGVLFFLNQRFNEAEPHLKEGFAKNWVAVGMLAALLYKRKAYDKATEAFERAVKANKKESLLWAMYAYCLWKQEDREGAINVLSRAKEHVTDERIDANLQALQNNKKMKMQGWKETWYQFQIEKPPAIKMPQTGMGGRISKKSMYR
jgi:tetratricopeptide (TPR) repeat protein